MFRKISYRAQQLVTYSWGSCQVLPPWPEQIKVPYARGKVFIPECWMGPLRAGAWCNSTISVNGAALWVWPCKEGTQPAPYTNSLVKKQASQRKQEIALIVFAISVLHLLNEAKPFVHSSPGRHLQQTHPAQASAVMNPTTLHRWAEHPAGFQTASYSRVITTAGWALLSPQWIPLELPPLRPLCCCSQEEVPVQWKHCRGAGMPQQWKARQLSSLPVNTGEGKDNLPGVMS